MLFTTVGILCGGFYNIFPMLGYKNKQDLFPMKNPFMGSWEKTISQNYPKLGISCPNLFPKMGKFPI